MSTRLARHLMESLLRSGETLVSRGEWHRRFTKATDYGLLGLMTVAPLVWGGRHDMGRLVFAFMVATTALAWIGRWWTAPRPLSLQLSRSLWIPVAAVLWLTLQVMPISPTILKFVAPHHDYLLPLWNGSPPFSLDGHVTWSTLSLSPTSTMVSLAVLMGYGLIFFVALQWLSTLDDITRLLRWVGGAATAMAVFGLLQHFTAGGRFFWVYDHPFRDTTHVVCGSFINRNHFANFVGIGTVACFANLMLAQQPLPRGAEQGRDSCRLHAMGWTLALAICGIALLLSFSRGGAAACAVAILVAAVVAWRGKLWAPRQIASVAFAASLVAGLLAFHKGDKLVDRLDDLGSGSLEQLDRAGGRRVIWAANLKAIAASWTTGTGAGTHREVAPAFMSESRIKPYTHAENGYLQIVTENGLVGALLLASTLVIVVGWTTTLLRRRHTLTSVACTAAVLGGLTLSLLHSLVDFVWFIPATMTLTVLLLAALCRLVHLSETGDFEIAASAPPTPSAATFPPSRRLDASLLVGGASLAMLMPLVRPALAASAWDSFLVYSTIQSAEEQRRSQMAQPDPDAAREAEFALLEAKSETLLRAIERDGSNYLPHLRLAQTLLQTFEARAPLRENQQGLSQLQATVTAGHFTTSAGVQEWLRRAVGADYSLLVQARHHARAALQLCPLDGTTYVCLAHLAFLDDPTGRLAENYLAQALRVRPHEGEVLFEHGKNQMMAGKLEQGLETWQAAFTQPGPHRELIIRVLAGRAPASAFLADFRPDWQTLPSLWQHYRAAGKPNDQAVLLEYARQQADIYVRTPGHPANVYIWRALAGMYRDGGDFAGELRCLESAMRLERSVYAIRHDLALALVRNQKYREAQAHFRWCLAIHPENKQMREAFEQAVRAERLHRAAVPPTSPAALR